MPNIYRAADVIASRREEALEMPQAVDNDEGFVGRSGAGAGGPVEHPLRQLECPA